MAASRKIRTAGDRRGVGVGAFLLAVVTAGALTHVAVRLKGLEVAYALGHERRVAADLEEQRRRLQIEIGMLKDPGRVVMIARDKLKMGPPAPEAIRALGPGKALTAPLPASLPPGLAAGQGR
jgi:cell division protein FtsL